MDGPCKHNLIAVYWIDAESHSGWVEHERVKPTVMVTVGYEVDKDEHFVYMASTHSQDATWSDLGLIPVGCIVKVEVIRSDFPCRGDLDEKDVALAWSAAI